MTEMEKLINKLAKADIPYELTVIYDTIQVWYPTQANPVCDAICHKYSYGGKDGYLEIMGLVDEAKTGDTVEGYLRADEVFDRIANHYRTHKTAEEVETNAEANWIDFLYADEDTGELFFVEVRDTLTAEDDAWEIATANFDKPVPYGTYTPEEAEILGYDTY